MTRRRARAAGLGIAAALAALLPACRARDAEPASARAEKSPAPEAAVPVRTAAATRATLERVVTAPGHTVALTQQRVRAPFAGTLVSLTKTDGDRVSRDESVGAIVSRDSEAALAGAREMLRTAATEAAKADAQRAVALAERDLIRAPLRAPVSGIVVAHGAAPGDRVSEDQELLTIADGDSVAFVADVPQSELAQVHAGQRAGVDLAGLAKAATGSVHGVLPAANPADFTAPVRIDLESPGVARTIGLFGTARIQVAEKRDALVVPDAAILRDDVTGQSRIAVVRDGHVHWSAAAVGLRGAAGTELLAPPLAPGDRVVVAGQVGLPEGAAVSPRP